MRVLRGHWSVWELDIWQHTMEITHEGFALVDDNDSIVLVTEPQMPMNLKSALACLAL